LEVVVEQNVAETSLRMRVLLMDLIEMMMDVVVH
jgi:hypothetical protein